MKKTGFYVAHGIEARYFILSGIADALKKSGQIVLFVSKSINSTYLDEYINLYDIKVQKIDDLDKSKKAKIIDKYARSFRNSRKRLKGINIYSHLGDSSNKKRFLDYIFGNVLVHIFFDFLFRKLLIKFNYNKEIERLFLENEIEEFYMLEYSNTVNNVIGSICSKNKIKVHLFLNSLKTVFINDFVSFNIYRLHTWNSFQKKIFSKANPNIKSVAFVSNGSPFHTFLRDENSHNITETLNKYKLDKSRPIIVYPLIYEKVYENEHKVIEMINNFFNTFNKESRPQLVLRQNPFQESNFLIKTVKNLPNVIIADNYWERNKSLNWSIQSIKGEQEWKALLQVSSLMVSYPSMSIVESINCGTPVLNIGFDQQGFENIKLKHIIHAPFIKEFEKSDFVSKCLKFDDFKDNYLLFKDLKSKNPNSKIASSLKMSKSDLSYFY